MTTPRPFDDLPPLALVHPYLRTAAGSAAVAEVLLTNRSSEPRILSVSCLGVDANWLPAPTRSRPMMPGESRALQLRLVPTVGTLPAQYPLAITVQALDPASGHAMSHAAVADLTLVVDAPGRIEVAVVPPETFGRRSKRVNVVLNNVGSAVEQVRLESHSPEAAELHLAHDLVEVAPGQTVTVPGRLKLAVRWFGKPSRFTYTVSARGSSAERRAEGAVTSKAFLGNNGPKAFALVAIVALWAALALIFIPKLATTIKNREAKASNQASSLQNQLAQKSASQAASGSPSGAGGGSGGGSGGGAGGGAGGGSGGGSGTATTTAAKSIQLSGTVGGDSPGGVTVSMKQTSLVDAAALGATGANGVDTASFSELGKTPEQALLLASPVARVSNRSIRTKSDGTWSFNRVSAPGYYLLTFDKPGYETQRYVIDSATAVAADPLAVTLVPGDGGLKGVVTASTNGALIGGAQVVISDGTTTFTTSTDTTGPSKGAWSVSGLSTPASYIVSVSKNGESTESAIVTLAASGHATQNLSLSSVSTSLSGTVRGPTNTSKNAPLGGVQVTVTDGATTRMSTTTTSGNLQGNYVIPGLTPGDYSITTALAGYLPQTQTITITKNEKSATAHLLLSSATSIVSGAVDGAQFDSAGQVIDQPGTTTPKLGPVIGAGLIMTSPTATYKTTSGAGGNFTMDGVAPGTYVLSAQYSGLNSAYTDVVVKAGSPTPVPAGALTLQPATTTPSTAITGYVSSASNPSGTLECPDPSITTECRLSFTLHDSDGNGVATSTVKSDNPSDFTKTSHLATYAPTGPTPYTLYANPGLPAGLYHLTVLATNYLPAIVSVRVASTGVVAVPQVSLFPTDTITGTINALSDTTRTVFTDGKQNYDVCVWAEPSSATGPAPSNCPDPSTVVPNSACQRNGTPVEGYGLVDATTESYKISGLCDGNYTVYVRALNAQFYDSSTVVTTETLAHGSTATYSPHIPRKGDVVLTLSQLDPTTGAVTPGAPDDLTGTVTCNADGDTNALDGYTVDLDGNVAGDQVTIPGIKTSGNVTCVVSGSYQDSSGDPTGNTKTTTSLSGTVTGLSVLNDQDTSASVTLTQDIPALYGRIVSSHDTSTQNPVGSTTITLSGVRKDGKSDSFTVTTDAKGCFAILPTGTPTPWTPPIADSSCGSFTPKTNAVTQDLLARRITVSVPESQGVQALTTTQPFVDARNDITVLPIADSTTGLALTTNDGSSAGGASIDIQPVANKAVGTDRIVSNVNQTNGGIVWNDPSFGTNLASPGTYSLKATLAGYQDINATITCPFNLNATTNNPPSCTTADSLQFVQLGGLSGDLVADLGATAGAPNHPLVGAKIAATLCQDSKGNAETYPACDGQEFDGGSDTTGHFEIDSGDHDLPINAYYHVVITAPGYTTVDIKQYIKSGDNTIDTQDPSTGLYTVPVPVSAAAITLSVGIATSPGTLYTCKDATPCVVLHRIDTNTDLTANATLDSSGRYVFPNVYPAMYTITASGTGLTKTTISYTVEPGSTDTTYDVPTALVQNTISGLVQGPTGSTGIVAGIDGVPVELGTTVKNPDGTTTFTVADGTDGKPLQTTTNSSTGSSGNFVFSTVPNGSYLIRYNSNESFQDAVPQYQEYMPPAAISVFNGQSSSQSQTLTRITHNVVVSIATDTAAGSVKTSTGFTLTAPTDPTWSYSPSSTSTSANGKTTTWTFLAIPAGKWALGFTLPANHLGTPTGTGVTVSCTDRPACAANLVVPGNPDDPTIADDDDISLTLDEYAITLGVLATSLPGDMANAPPSTADVTLTDAKSNPVYENKSFPVSTGNSVPAANATTIWANNDSDNGGTTYTGAATYPASYANWTTNSVPYSSASADTPIPLTETGSTVTVTVSGTPPSGYSISSVVLNPPSKITYTTAYDAGTTYVFEQVPWSSTPGWTATVTATSSAKGAADKTWTSATVPVNSATTAIPVTVK